MDISWPHSHVIILFDRVLILLLVLVWMQVILDLIEDGGDGWLDAYPFDIIEPALGALAVTTDSQLIGSSSKGPNSPEVLLFLKLARTEAKGTIGISIHHEVIVRSTAASVGLVVPHVFASLHLQDVVILIFDVLSSIYLIEIEVEVDKLFEPIAVTDHRSIPVWIIGRPILVRIA